MRQGEWVVIELTELGRAAAADYYRWMADHPEDRPKPHGGDEMKDGRAEAYWIRQQAEEELRSEKRRALVEQEKQRLRTARPWWAKFFPWVIKVERRK
jgi:hypothetical protein